MSRKIEFREDIEYLIDNTLITTKVKLRKDCKGWYKENGYIMRKVNNHPNANKRGYVAEHRLIMEKYLGRFLDTKEVVHHLDEDRENNSLSNLKLEIWNGEHIKNEHKKGRNSKGQFVCQEPIFNEIIFRLYDKDKKVTLEYTLNKLISTTFRRSKFEFRGRYTGLKDKNGKKIFEGDIVKNKWTSISGKNIGKIWEVKFGEYDNSDIEYGSGGNIGFYVCDIKYGKEEGLNNLPCDKNENIEVIGTIYDKENNNE